MEFLYRIKELIQNIPQIIIFLVIAVVGLYVFWRGCAESRKNRSSVFDIFLFSGFFGIVVGRVVHIILNWEEYSSFIWYWIPYEKYGDKVYLFRLLPWRFLSVWDGGLVILAAYVAMILSMTFFSLVYKKWRWKDLFLPIFFSTTSMLGVSFIYIGINSGFTGWIYKGSILIATFLIYFFLYSFVERIFKKKKIGKYTLGYIGVGLVVALSGYISYSYLISGLSLLENTLVGIYVIWSLIMSGAFIIDLRKPAVNIERVSSVRSVSTK